MMKRNMWLLIIGLLAGTLGSIGSTRGQAAVTLEQVEGILREEPALNITRLWQDLENVLRFRESEEGEKSLFGFSPDQAKPWIIDAGTWEYSVIVPEAVGGVKPACPGIKIIRIRDNRWDHQLLLFAARDSQWIYAGNLAFFAQKSKEPLMGVYDRGDNSCLYPVSWAEDYGIYGDAEVFSFYQLSESGPRPVLTVLKDGYVQGGESMSDRRYQGVIEPAAPGNPGLVTMTYTVSYYGDSLGYSYDQRFTDQPPTRMLLSSVNKKACFFWDESSQSYLFDEEKSSLSEEDRQAILNR